MKIIVTHLSPDWDAITSVWLLKKYLSDWHDAHVMFVPAGQRLNNAEPKEDSKEPVIEKKGEDEVIHVDTGLAPLDHHQTQDRDVSAASLTWEYVQEELRK
jgi:nanoRNase/pAp phosphatase (c-di-AMP/oligoRNAs hydrolase)